MPNLHRYYLKHMHNKTGYRATWDPTSPLKIGQIGKLEDDGSFSVHYTLEDKGIIPKIEPGPAKGGMDYTSEQGVTVSVKAAGKAPIAGSVLTNADAGFNVAFSSDRGIVFKTEGHKNSRITNIGDIQKAVVKLLDEDKWDKDWLIITEIVESDNATVIISTSNNSTLEIKAAAGVGTENLKITDASLGLSIVNRTGATLNYLAAEHVTPLYKVMGLRHPLFKKWELQGKNLQEDTEMPDLRYQDFNDEEVDD